MENEKKITPLLEKNDEITSVRSNFFSLIQRIEAEIRTAKRSKNVGREMSCKDILSDLLCCLKELEKKKVSEVELFDVGTNIEASIIRLPESMVLWSDVKRFFGDKK